MQPDPQSSTFIGARRTPAPCGLLAGAKVMTLDGALPVEYLTPGDRIVTRVGARRLMSVSVRQARQATLVRIRAATVGHDRPQRDLLVAPGQLVIIRDWRATALYAAPAAAIPAARLTDGAFVVTGQHRDVRLFTLRFETDAVIYAEGLELACPATAAARPGRAALTSG